MGGRAFFFLKDCMMTQFDLDFAVACATGESLSEIRRRGFSIADPTEVWFDPEPDQLVPQMIDWDDEAQGSIPIPGRCGTRRRRTRRLQSVR
jgi:hypothetical protein